MPPLVMDILHYPLGDNEDLEERLAIVSVNLLGQPYKIVGLEYNSVMLGAKKVFPELLRGSPDNRCAYLSYIMNHR